MTVEPPAETLRRAADLVEQRAAKATPGPWKARANIWGEAWVHHTRTAPVLPLELYDWADDPQRAQDDEAAIYAAVTLHPDGAPRAAGSILQEDAAWVAMLGPQVASALAAWLRQAAGQAEVAAEFIPAVITDSGVLDTSFVVEHALTFARLLLGETS